MVIWIFGVGGIGSVIAGRLASRWPDMLLVEDWEAHRTELLGAGLSIQYPDELVQTGPLRAVSSEVLAAEAPPDLILLCTKAYDVVSAARKLAPMMRPTTVLVCLQNGVVVDALVRELPAECIVAGSAMFDGEVLAPGRARQLRRKPLILGNLRRGDDDDALRVAEVLSVVAPVQTAKDIEAVLWSKLVNNTANALTAIANLGVGSLLGDPRMREIWIGLAGEAIAAAKLRGTTLDPGLVYGGHPDSYLAPRESRQGKALREGLSAEFAPYPDLRSTMLQDIEKRRRTEIDALNGYVARVGNAWGLETPLNSAVIPIIERIESGWQPSEAERGRILDGLFAKAEGQFTQRSAVKRR